MIGNLLDFVPAVIQVLFGLVLVIGTVVGPDNSSEEKVSGALDIIVGLIMLLAAIRLFLHAFNLV